MMELVLVTGMAGAGKSCVLNAMEDIGYYVVDNLPLTFLRQFVSHCLEKGGKLSRVAMVIDIRSCECFPELAEAYRTLKIELRDDIHCRMVCLEASEQILLTRFRTARRSHPLAGRFGGDLSRAIAYESEHLQSIRAAADVMLDTSLLSNSQLKEQIKMQFTTHLTDTMLIQVMSFGFKYGAPLEADLMFDMRCLPNPYYIPELKHHTGIERCVQDYVMHAPESQAYFEKITNMLDFLIPLYIREGRTQLAIGFGCTGGHHRSVTFAELVSEHLRNHDWHILTLHRDYKKEK